ncbi:choline dehydrogenase-like flavoprotein [Friedmanniella endophytica]|uniref:Choline dehydrogenase-like flavoprotein n=1 Tax=Microlunatus kandeliicorticis TaxID=1759536 RepID=A0A7W3P470_9ACTN|nr:GMC family oxidoreductase [Microlunatus kandeliicorticis]MBA8792553.1 choline dehydrogenase-like flavoprotein [Microlunatus kandeliicorticis]
MNLESMPRYDPNEPADVVVVGTGAGGGPLLARLADAGLRVVALEAGMNHDPRDHTPDEDTAAAGINWMEERISAGDDPTAFGPNNSGRGVGGSLLHWGAFTPRPDPRDLRLRSLAGVGVDWPIGHAELTGYLEQVETDVGVSGPADYPWDPDRRYAMPPPRRNAPAELMIAACTELGIRATDAPAAVLTRDRDDPQAGLRLACVNCGSCHQGCRTGAKGGTDVSYLPRAVAAGAEIRAGATVHTVETDATGQVTGVVYRQDGRDVRQRCDRLVLAAGAVETPRLLLHTGLALGSGQVGANFMAHGATQVWGRFDREIRSYRGYPSAAITEDFVRPADADFAGGYLIQSLGVQPLTFATTLARGAGLWGRALVEALDAYPHMAGVGINAECLPRAENRLTLADETDALGVPKARVSFSAGPNEQAIDAHATRTMIAILEAAGARTTTVVARTAHTIGTCRMGTDPAAAVVDPDGRSFEVPNLWICDNSVFPSSVVANPALTIMALSLRTADRMLAAA